MTTAEVTEMERRLSARDLSFDVSPDNDEEEATGRPRTCRPRMRIPPSRSRRRNGASSSHEQLTAAMDRLDERSRTILRRRWMTDDKATLHELASEYGVSAERIRQIEAGAITRLKALLPAPA